VESGNDQVSVDRLATTGSILKQSLCFAEIDKGFFNEILCDEILGPEIELFEFIDVLVCLIICVLSL
jgi:hypothetical protein